MALIHFIFEIFKISILSAVYSTILYFGLKWVLKKTNAINSVISNANKTAIWFTTWAMICVILFVYMFSYYGNHGLGDSFRIPIAHRNALHEIDSSSYIIDDRNRTYNIDEFFVTDDFVYGTLDTFRESKNTAYFVFDLKLQHNETFENKATFSSYLISKELNKNVKYQEFSYYYDQYWNGWRFFLLP